MYYFIMPSNSLIEVLPRIKILVIRSQKVNVSLDVFFHVFAGLARTAYPAIRVLVMNYNSTDELISHLPAYISSRVYQMPFWKAQALDVQLHTLQAVLPIGWAAKSIAARAFGSLKPPCTVKFASCAQMRTLVDFIEIKRIFLKKFLRLIKRLRATIHFLYNLIKFILMKKASMLDYLLRHQLLIAKLAANLFEILALSLKMSLFLLKYVLFLAKLTNQLHFVDYCLKRAGNILERTDSAKRAFIINSFYSVYSTRSTKKYRTFRVLAKNTVDGIFVAYFTGRVLLTELKKLQRGLFCMLILQITLSLRHLYIKIIEMQVKRMLLNLFF